MMNLIRVNLRHWLHSRILWALAGAAFVSGIVNAFGAFHERLSEQWEFKGEFYPAAMTVSLLCICMAGVLCINQPEVRRLQTIAGYPKLKIFFAELVPVLIFAALVWLIQLPAMLWCRTAISALNGKVLFRILLGILLLFCGFGVCSIWITAAHHRYAAAIILPVWAIAALAFCNHTAEKLEEPKYCQRYEPLVSFVQTEEVRRMAWEDMPLVAVPERNRMYQPEVHELPEKMFILLPHASLSAAANYLKAGWTPHGKYAGMELDELLEQRAYWENISGVLPAVALSWLIVLTVCGAEEFRHIDLN